MIIHLEISDNIFGGFQHFERITEEITALDILVERTVNKLREHLTFFNLISAIDRLSEKQFHIHDLTLDEVKQSNAIVYVCTCG